MDYTISNESDMRKRLQEIKEAQAFIGMARSEILRFLVQEKMFDFFSVDWKKLERYCLNRR